MGQEAQHEGTWVLPGTVGFPTLAEVTGPRSSSWLAVESDGARGFVSGGAWKI